MEKLFNTDFEISLRVLLLLYVFDDFLSQDTIRDLDLLSTYGKEFKISNTNLHGDNSYSFTEIASRYSIVKNALKILVKDSYVTIKSSSAGFSYKISDLGKLYAESLTSDYSDQYKSEANKVKQFTRDMNDSEIHRFTYKGIIRRDE